MEEEEKGKGVVVIIAKKGLNYIVLNSRIEVKAKVHRKTEFGVLLNTL
jgi:hypothetical protein